MADLYSGLASSIGSLFGASDSTTNTLSGIASIAGGAYDLYSGIQAQNQYNDYMSQLVGSTKLSDKLLQEQATRAKNLYYPIEDLEAQYALEDLQNMRGLQTAQQNYAIQQGMDDIAYAQNTIDPLRYQLLDQLAAGVDAQKYMDQASVDVAQSYGQAMNDASRSYSRLGINPNSGAMQNLVTQGTLAQAAAQAAARTESARTAEDLDLQRRQQALNLWSGIPVDTQQVSQSGTTLASQAASGLTSATSGLTNAAALANQAANTGFAGASANFLSAADSLSNSSGTSVAGTGLGTNTVSPLSKYYR